MKIRALEIYDSFHPERLLEVNFVVWSGRDFYYDFKKGEKIFTETGRTFRASYGSLAEILAGKDIKGKKEKK